MDTHPADRLLPRVQPPRRAALGLLTRDEGDRLRTFEGKRVVPLDSESANYREWLVTIGDTPYCIVCEVCDGETWTVMVYNRTTDLWDDAPDTVEAFLSTHKLILAA